jgi:hypothetical protein
MAACRDAGAHAGPTVLVSAHFRADALWRTDECSRQGCHCAGDSCGGVDFGTNVSSPAGEVARVCGACVRDGGVCPRAGHARAAGSVSQTPSRANTAAAVQPSSAPRYRTCRLHGLPRAAWRRRRHDVSGDRRVYVVSCRTTRHNSCAEAVGLVRGLGDADPLDACVPAPVLRVLESRVAPRGRPHVRQLSRCSGPERGDAAGNERRNQDRLSDVPRGPAGVQRLRRLP